ncbi:putative membrane protein YfcA [Bhargavaea ullalensis]|uniref:Membrane protein YfcA n=1 Tax=Bhargavaea ullalensis TaxID=1265685 RepID=A0ABV2GEK7_9BACL
MEKGSVGTALFTGVFVGVIMFLYYFLVPDTNFFITVVVAGVSAWIGSMIGNKLFPNKQ